MANLQAADLIRRVGSTGNSAKLEAGPAFLHCGTPEALTDMSYQTADGIKWIEEQVHSMAGELGIRLDGPPEWDAEDLNLKIAVEVGGQRKILTQVRHGRGRKSAKY